MRKQTTCLAQQLGSVFDNTAIVVMSKFGRTAKQIGNGSTDDGHSNVMWLLGERIKGGKALSTQALHEQRDLPVTTDFRSVLANVVKRHLSLSNKQLVKLFRDNRMLGQPISTMHS